MSKNLDKILRWIFRENWLGRDSGLNMGDGAIAGMGNRRTETFWRRLLEDGKNSMHDESDKMSAKAIIDMKRQFSNLQLRSVAV